MAAYQRMNPRLFSLAGLLGCLFLVLLGGLAWRQIFLSSTYAKDEREQSMRRILEPGPRGRILDREGRVLVENRPNYSVVLYVDELRDEFRTEYYRLRKQWLAQHGDDTTEVRPTYDSNKLLNQARVNVVLRYLNQANTLLNRTQTLDATALQRHIDENLLLPYRLIENLTAEEYARFNARMPVESPMQTSVEAMRNYPYGSLASHVLGWVSLTTDINGDNVPGADLPTQDNFAIRGMEGRDGLELSHDAQLHGDAGGEIWMVDPAAALFERKEQKTPKQGADFQCSIDLDLQQEMEKIMSVKINEGKEDLTGAAVAIDVRTGEILAMTSKPDYDLNDTVPNISNDKYNDINARGAWLNRVTQGLYPAGSTFKLVDTIAGLRSGKLDEKPIYCPPFITIGNRNFKEDEIDIPGFAGFGNIGVVTAIEKSSDVFFYQVGLNLGPQRIASEARRLGLGQSTGIAAEIAETAQKNMIIPDAEWKKKYRPGSGPWTDGDTANLAVGQGYVLVTPLQMACLVASIARNETRTIPTLTHNPNLPPDYAVHEGEPLGLTSEQRQLLLEGMGKVVSNEGTGKFAQLPEFPGLHIAGKTGTAQWGPALKTTVAWFVCFAPIEDPRIAVVVTIESPEKGANLYGGTVCAPYAADILREYFKEHPEALLPTTASAAKN
jgi:penicillin-binding protein 2